MSRALSFDKEKKMQLNKMSTPIQRADTATHNIVGDAPDE
jgi:hypothetical protein